MVIERRHVVERLLARSDATDAVPTIEDVEPGEDDARSFVTERVQFARGDHEDIGTVASIRHETDEIVEALDHGFHQDRLDVLLGDEFGDRGERNRFGLVDANREPHVDCGVHGTPRGMDTRGDSVLTGVSCY